MRIYYANYITYRSLCPQADEIIWWVLLTGLFIQPFVYWTPAAIAYEIPRVWFVRGFILVLAMLNLRNVLFSAKKQSISLSSRILIFIGLFFSSALISSALGPYFIKSLIGNPYRLEGLVTLLLLVGLGVIVSIHLNEKRLSSLLHVFGLSGVVLSTWSVLDGIWLHVFHGFVPNWYGAIGLSFGQPNFLAGYLLVTLPVYWWWWQIWKRPWARCAVVLGVTAQVAAISLTFSWGALLGVGVFGALVILHTFLPKQKWILLLTTLVAIALFIGAAVAQNWTVYNPESRTRIYQSVLQGYSERPILGWGWANVDFAFKAGTKSLLFNDDIYLDKAHSSVLEVLVTTGAVGLLFYLALLWSLWQSLRKKSTEVSSKKKNAGAALQNMHMTFLFIFLLYLYHTQTNVVSIAEEVVFWAVVGVGMLQALE